MSPATCLVFVAVFTPFSANAASSGIFPSLRKKQAEQERLVLVEQKPDEKTPSPVESAKKDETQVAVPDPVDVGADGLPRLPEVSTMLSEASGTLKSVNSQASNLEAKVVQGQMQSETKMSKQKAAYEMKLKQQEENNRKVIAANAKISAEIKQLKSSNAAFKKHAREIEETNRVMRSQLHTLQSREVAAMQFIDKSLESTDDSKNALLQVLQASGVHHSSHRDALMQTSKADDDDDKETEDGEDSDESDEEDSDEPSFLSVAQETHLESGDISFEAEMDELDTAAQVEAPVVAAPDAQEPDHLLEVLAKQVAQLAQQEKESEKKLKELFIRDFRAGAKRHQALLVQQKSLNASRGSLLTLQSQLKAVEAHLEGVRHELQSRLHGLGQMFQKLAHFAMAPQREIPHLLAVLPKDVTIPAK
jgi:hypothetical protein